MKKVLVANRGEIALRVMQTLRKMGIASVAVYSEIDREAPHVLYADETVLLGPSPSSLSYLNMDKIINEAIDLGVDGIHPGYGFLSENAVFAKKVNEAGIEFIGPSIKAIETMGSKLAAKEAVKTYGIPMVPGIDRAVEDVKVAIDIAKKVGLPVLIKASAGGGGKGMRIVEDIEDLPSQMERAISEALSAFGDGSVFIEKYVSSPRHIEFQILADKHGNIIHLFERECSIQRRHQKVVEEAPSVLLDDQLRQKMGKAAVNVARSCNYVGAGTVEFLLDEKRNFYFLEMNTRLQVEHPVTEFISGIDLVEQQIRIARGEKLSPSLKNIEIKGHALELRVYAEDPMNDFLPSMGKLDEYEIPFGEGIRVDDGYRLGMEIPIYYDPMISKLITYGSTRAESIQKMSEAIDKYLISGVKTTLPFGKFVVEHPAFINGKFDTHFVKKYFTTKYKKLLQEGEAKVAAQLALNLYLKQKKNLVKIQPNGKNWFHNRKNNA